jgi:hypothetical protein
MQKILLFFLHKLDDVFQSTAYYRNMKHRSQIIRGVRNMKAQLFKSVLAVATASMALGSFATQASAVNLTPSQEGEIDVGLGCIDPNQCLETSDNNLFPFIDSIVSEVDATTGWKSRLFIDNRATKSVYGENITLQQQDAGTNHAGFWFRPSEYNEDGYSEERGQLEVGTYTFNFSTVFEELTLKWFDTESNKTTGAIAINGVAVEEWVPSGSNNNIFEQTFKDVQSITLKMGKDNPSGTGDGVNFQMFGTPAPAPESVPEPATLGGLAVVGLALAGRRKLQNRDNA